MTAIKRSNSVAVLDTKRNTFRVCDRAVAEKLHSQKVSLPRFKSSVHVYVNVRDQHKEEYLATVHVWRLGLGYNIERILGWSKELWVIMGPEEVA
ncbi:hypothetical protein QBC37DRAFT_434110 [Rhypophila decipiens]|uniref:Uncharacterized protein n=1 Tax=Rhypophila decipiens TaxID=261697 RepID=A0AAN6XUT7_9PEZI|nr:hypothetical protein QBC37DRAFT_434110 [Rhypophila decipiens]